MMLATNNGRVERDDGYNDDDNFDMRVLGNFMLDMVRSSSPMDLLLARNMTIKANWMLRQISLMDFSAAWCDDEQKREAVFALDVLQAVVVVVVESMLNQSKTEWPDENAKSDDELRQTYHRALTMQHEIVVAMSGLDEVLCGQSPR
ncbi:MAG: hypothetical protein CMA63_06690 [Euryarchaeota archaeon]|nr:hypothetical protein [Euryarchaeota archaeon]|tara:strand:- start:3780 stop:4220 length:441 start_codon:yes stop_codon:yes gene_type:complete